MKRAGLDGTPVFLGVSGKMDAEICKKNLSLQHKTYYFYVSPLLSALTVLQDTYPIIKPASGKWQEIGRCLGLSSSGTLQGIQATKGNEPEKALYAVLFAWLNGKDNAKLKGITWSTLIRALKHRSVNEPEISLALREAFSSQKLKGKTYKYRQ